MNFLPKKKWKRWAVAILVVLVCGEGVFLAFMSASTGAAPSGEAIRTLEESSNYREGRFVNGIPAREPQIFRALKEWVKGVDHTVPDGQVPVVMFSKADFASLPESGLRITWLGHSTTLLEIDGVRLLLDPVWSERAGPFSWTGPRRFHDPPLSLADLPEVDVVLISHDHYDHLDKDTVVHLAREGLRFVVPLGVGSRLRSWDIPGAQIEELDWWEETRVGDITVTATPARHFSGRSLVMADRNETLWAGFALVGKEHSLYYTGDTGMFPGFREIGERLGPFDATLVEVGAYNKLWADLHLGPEQAVQAVKDARGGLLVPVHWGTFELAMHSWVEPAERLIVATTRQDVALAIPMPGQSVEPSDPPELVRWWPELPWQTEDEHPVVSSGLSAP